MKTRTHQHRPVEETSYRDRFEDQIDLDALSDEELEALLFEEQSEERKGLFNLPTIAGLSMIVVGIAYLFQQLGILGGFDLGALATMLPWLAGILIILLGFGVLSWRPKKKKVKKKTVRKEIEVPSGERVVVESPRTSKEEKSDTKKRLRRSRDKKIAGVCAGLGEYFNIDPTLVRIGFVIATIATNGAALVAYFVLAMVMGKPEDKPPMSKDKVVNIVKDN